MSNWRGEAIDYGLCKTKSRRCWRYIKTRLNFSLSLSPKEKKTRASVGRLSKSTEIEVLKESQVEALVKEIKRRKGGGGFNNGTTLGFAIPIPSKVWILGPRLVIFKGPLTRMSRSNGNVPKERKKKATFLGGQDSEWESYKRAVWE